MKGLDTRQAYYRPFKVDYSPEDGTRTLKYSKFKQKPRAISEGARGS
jgi:hypothetical protein